MLQSPNTTNTDLLTMVSLNTKRSNESLTSNNTNIYAGDFCNFDIMFIETSLNSSQKCRSFSELAIKIQKIITRILHNYLNDKVVKK